MLGLYSLSYYILTSLYAMVLSICATVLLSSYKMKVLISSNKKWRCTKMTMNNNNFPSIIQTFMMNEINSVI